MSIRAIRVYAVMIRSVGKSVFSLCGTFRTVPHFSNTLSTASRLRISKQGETKMKGHLVFRTVVLLFLTFGKFYSFTEYPLQFICYCLMCLLQ